MSGKKIKLQQSDIERIRAVKEMLDQIQRPHTTIEELAYKAGMNRTKLQYGFRKLFGQSIYSYQVRLRMDKAQRFLEETDRPIKQVASLSGYNTISSFSAAFKKTFGLSPLQWRNKHQ